MRTAIACTEPDADATIDRHFGKCQFFCLVDEKTGKMKFVANPGLNSEGCRGEMIVDYLVSENIKKVISGDFGTNVQKLLNEHKIQMILYPDSPVRISEVIKLLTHK
jgi:predicted Fe-Mo cluster-binding NifX family protein